MIYFLRDFFYFNNETHYLKNLSNKNNTKDFNGIIQGKKKYSFIQIFILLLIIIIFCSISIYSYIKIFFISMTIFILINLIAKIIITNNFSNSYFYIDDETLHGFLIDPGAEAEKLLQIISKMAMY